MKQLEDQIGIDRKQQRIQLENQFDVRIRPNGEITVSKDDTELMDRLGRSEAFIYSAETYMNTTFKIRQTEQVGEWLCALEGFRYEEEEAEFAVRKDLSLELGKWVDLMEENALRIGVLDLLVAKSAFAVGYQCVMPEFDIAGGLHIEEGRHLKVEAQLKSDGRAFEAISIHIDRGVTCITGANMGGKTVTLKLLGMLVAMAQYGLFVPAKAMKLAPRSFIYTSIGDLQDIDQGLSTFGAEIVKVRDAVKIAGLDGLILVDELARGTNPREGYAISKAIIHHLKKQPSMTVITTHFDGLADEPDVKHLQVMGLSGANFEQIMLEMENDPQRGLALLHESMDYRLKEIHHNEEVPKDAIHIAQLMGLDEGILEEAKRVLIEK
jgi:DNA mismatch repair ATPase MutS